MKAAILETLGSPLAIRSVPDPVLGTGEVLVDVAACGVLPYTDEVLDGRRKYMFGLPMIPGPSAVGRVRAVGPDATRLSVGDWVFCDCTVRSRDDVRNPDIVLQGASARGEGGMKLHRYFHDGGFAEQVRIPTENAIRLGAIDPADAARWCILGLVLVPFGGLLKADLRPGEALLVSGATGNFGSAAVAVALALGARVVAPGRNEAMLDELVRRFGKRVRPVKLTGDEETDRRRMEEAGPIDCVIDLLPPSVSPVPVRAAMMAVRPYGRIVLMGGVGFHGGPGLELSYRWIMRSCISIHGAWMYPPDANARMVDIVRTGLLDLAQWDVTTFPLDRANEAVAHAASSARPFSMTALTV